MKQETRDKLERAGLLPPKENHVADNQPVAQQGIVFTVEMIQQMIATAVAVAIQETKKLSPEDQEEYDAKKKRERENRVRRVKEALQYERDRRATQFLCSHIKSAEGVYKQEHAFRGQVNNDNCCRAQCIRCNKLFPPFKVTEENMKSGMALQNLKGLEAKHLYQMHMKSFPDCPECMNGACAVRDLRELAQGRLDPLPTVLPSGKVSAEQLTA